MNNSRPLSLSSIHSNTQRATVLLPDILQAGILL